MEDKQCDHLFKAQIKKLEQLQKGYLGEYKHENRVLVQEQIYIFCIKCGESHRIDEDIIQDSK